MNERIRELYQEAGFRTWRGMGDNEFERFAKLMVQEVLSVQEQLIAKGHNAWHLHDLTKEHFGVE